MTQLMTLLTFYYLCDQAAAHRGLTPSEVEPCMANYEVIKLEFIDELPAPIGTVERAQQNLLGYAGLKAWEKANADLVRQMRAEARGELGLG